MERSRRRPSPGTVLALLALVIAAAGTAIAGPLATTSVLNKKEKKQVKNIAKSQVNQLAPGLAVASANKANSADTAGNANLLDGLDAADFTPADEVHSSGRVVVNDPTPGDTVDESATLITAGAFSVEGDCLDAHPTFGDVANVTLRGPSGSSFSGTRSNAPQEINVESVAFISVGLAEGPEVVSLHLTAVAPNGETVSISASAEAGDPAGDCVFGATAIGP
jgi:hypothetical protein